MNSVVAAASRLRMRRSQHKAIKIGSDSASDAQEKDLKKKSIIILVYCYVGEKVGHHEHVVEVCACIFSFLFLFVACCSIYEFVVRWGFRC